MSLFRFLLILYTVATFTNCISKPANKIKNLKGFEVSTDSVTTFLEASMDSMMIPGLSIAIINQSKVVYHRTIGYADIEKKIPVSNHTIFEAASLSKPVFSFFVMGLVEEGKLDLDKPLYQYLPYPDIAHDEHYKKITARMVLSHRSGFPNWRENEEDGELKIKFEPGTDYEYSGEGYQYLANVLRHIEQTDWKGLETLFQTKVAEPLEMQHTAFIPTIYTMQNKAQPYDENDNRIDWKYNYWYKKNKGVFVAPSSLHTESLDFSKWMIAVMNEDLLSKESYSELFKRHSLTATTENEINIYYTLGFLNPDREYSNTYIHNGNNEGFTCWFLLDTMKDWGYVLFTNSDKGSELGNMLWDYFEREKY